MRHRFELAGDGVFSVFNDLAFQESIHPSAIATLWIYAAPRLLITVRNHASLSADTLREAARQGVGAHSGFDVLNRLLEFQNEALRGLVGEIAKEVDHSEDMVVGGVVAGQREQLGRIRRQCLYLRRHFFAQRTAVKRFLAHPRADFHFPEGDLSTLRSLFEDRGFVIGPIGQPAGTREAAAGRTVGAGRRAHGPQPLRVDHFATIILLPMTLVTGIFGMNIAGVPGVGDTATSAAFWWVMLLDCGRRSSDAAVAEVAQDGLKAEGGWLAPDPRREVARCSLPTCQ